MINELIRLLTYEMSDEDCEEMIRAIIPGGLFPGLWRSLISSLKRDLPNLDENEVPSWYTPDVDVAWDDFLAMFFRVVVNYLGRSSASLGKVV